GVDHEVVAALWHLDLVAADLHRPGVGEVDALTDLDLSTSGDLEAFDRELHPVLGHGSGEERRLALRGRCGIGAGEADAPRAAAAGCDRGSKGSSEDESEGAS